MNNRKELKTKQFLKIMKIIDFYRFQMEETLEKYKMTISLGNN